MHPVQQAPVGSHIQPALPLPPPPPHPAAAVTAPAAGGACQRQAPHPLLAAVGMLLLLLLLLQWLPLFRCLLLVALLGRPALLVERA